MNKTKIVRPSNNVFTVDGKRITIPQSYIDAGGDIRYYEKIIGTSPEYKQFIKEKYSEQTV
jgi:hypothetical protein